VLFRSRKNLTKSRDWQIEQNNATNKECELCKRALTIFTDKKNKIKEIEPELSEPVISQKTATQLTSMLISVVENGFAKMAKIPGYYVAGKTGTAQIPFSSLEIKKTGYSDQTIQSFIGFAPAFNPKFLIMVKLDAPQTKDASVSAVTIFREMASYIINLWQIPPDYDEDHPPSLILSSNS